MKKIIIISLISLFMTITGCSGIDNSNKPEGSVLS